MAKKIDTELSNRLKNIGITAKSDDDARAKLLKALEKEGIEGMDDESTEVLIDMVESFRESDAETDDNEEEVDDVEENEDDAEANELADEVEEEEEEDTEDEPEEEEPVEEEKPAPKSKSTKKEKAEKPVKKSSDNKPSKEKKTSTVKKRGNKLDPKKNAEDREPLNGIKEMFGEGYEFEWLASNGGTLKHAGKNGKRGVVGIENMTRQDDGNVTCNMYLLTMKNDKEMLDEMGIDYSDCWTGAPFMKCITITEAEEILGKLLEHLTGAVKKIDKRLGENRKKMEESLEKGKKANAKKAATPKAEEPESEDDEVEDDEDETPAPPKKAVPAKKAVKKAKK